MSFVYKSIYRPQNTLRTVNILLEAFSKEQHRILGLEIHIITSEREIDGLASVIGIILINSFKYSIADSKNVYYFI